jgi:HlyD family secretion protein
VAQQDRDTARAAYDAYRAQVVADEAQIDAGEHSVQSSRAQAHVAQTQLTAAEAQQRQSQSVLSQARINLAHTKILAPVSGTVIARYMDVGQTVAASFQAPTIFNIAQDLTKMQVDTSVNESDIGAVRVGQTASFTVDAFPGVAFGGPILDIRKAPITAQNVVTYDVVIAAENPELKLFPGMTANVTICTARQDSVLKVPNAALRFRPADIPKSVSPAQPDPQSVYVLTNGAMRSVPVKLGISDGKFTVLNEGDLRAGDRVVVTAITAAQATTEPSSGSPRRLPGL